MKEAKMEGLAHVELFVSDIKKTKAFYTEILGFEVIHETTGQEGDDIVKICFLKSGNLILCAAEFPTYTKSEDGIINHFAISVTNIEKVKEKLEKKGLKTWEKDEITYAPNYWDNGTKWILFRGPDGERLELCEIL